MTVAIPTGAKAAIVVFVVGLAGIGAWVGVDVMRNSSGAVCNAGQRQLPDPEFRTRCERLASARLRSPQLADFPSFVGAPDIQAVNGCDLHWVTYVDHPNLFGVPERMNYVCHYNATEQTVGITLQK